MLNHDTCAQAMIAYYPVVVPGVMTFNDFGRWAERIRASAINGISEPGSS